MVNRRFDPNMGAIQPRPVTPADIALAARQVFLRQMAAQNPQVMGIPGLIQPSAPLPPPSGSVRIPPANPPRQVYVPPVRQYRKDEEPPPVASAAGSDDVVAGQTQSPNGMTLSPPVPTNQPPQPVNADQYRYQSPPNVQPPGVPSANIGMVENQIGQDLPGNDYEKTPAQGAAADYMTDPRAGLRQLTPEQAEAARAVAEGHYTYEQLPEDQQRKVDGLQKQIDAIESQYELSPKTVADAERMKERTRPLYGEIAKIYGYDLDEGSGGLTWDRLKEIAIAGMEILDAPRGWQVDKAGNLAYQVATTNGELINSDSFQGEIGDFLANLAAAIPSGIAAILGEDPVDTFYGWMRNHENWQAIKDAYEKGFGVIKVDTDGDGKPDAYAPAFTGGRAVWELFVSSQSSGYKFVYDVTMDPTVWGSLFITGPMSKVGEGVVEGARLGQGVFGLGPGASAVIGNVLRAPEAVIQSPDLLLKGAGKGAGNIARWLPGGWFEHTDQSVADLEAEEIGRLTGTAMEEVNATGAAQSAGPAAPTGPTGGGPGGGTPPRTGGPWGPSPWGPSSPTTGGPPPGGGPPPTNGASAVTPSNNQTAAQILGIRPRGPFTNSATVNTGSAAPSPNPAGSFVPAPSSAATTLSPEDESVRIIHQITSLSDELNAAPTPERKVEIESEIARLNDRYNELNPTDQSTAADLLKKGSPTKTTGPKPGALDDTSLPEDVVNPTSPTIPSPPPGSIPPLTNTVETPTGHKPVPKVPEPTTNEVAPTEPFDYDTFVDGGQPARQAAFEEGSRNLPAETGFDLAGATTTKEQWVNDLRTGAKTVNNPILGRTPSNDTHGGQRMVDELFYNSVTHDDPLAARQAYEAALDSKRIYDAEMDAFDVQVDNDIILRSSGRKGEQAFQWSNRQYDKVAGNNKMPPVHQQVESLLPGYRHAVKTFEINRDILGKQPALRLSDYIVAPRNPTKDIVRSDIEKAIFGTPSESRTAMSDIGKSWGSTDWGQKVTEELADLRKRVTSTYDPNRAKSMGLNQETRTAAQRALAMTGGTAAEEARAAERKARLNRFIDADRNRGSETPPTNQTPAERAAGPPVTDPVSNNTPVPETPPPVEGNKPVKKPTSGIHREKDVTKPDPRTDSPKGVQTIRKTKTGGRIVAKETGWTRENKRFIVGFEGNDGTLMLNGSITVGWSDQHEWFELLNDSGELVAVIDDVANDTNGIKKVLKEAGDRVAEGRVSKMPGRWTPTIGINPLGGIEQKFANEMREAGAALIDAERMPAHYASLDPKLQEAVVKGRIGTDEAYFLNQMVVDKDGNPVRIIDFIKDMQGKINPNTSEPYNFFEIAAAVTDIARTNRAQLFDQGRGKVVKQLVKDAEGNWLVRNTRKVPKGATQFFRENALYNPWTGYAGASRDVLSNAFMIAASMDSEAGWHALARNMDMLIRNYDQNALVEELKTGRRALGLGRWDPADLEAYANAGITGSNTPMAQKFAGRLANAMGAPLDSRTEELAKHIGGILASKSVRDRRVGADVVARTVLHDARLAHYAGDFRLDFLHAVDEQGRRLGMTFDERQAAKDAIAQIGIRVNDNVLFSPTDVEVALKNVGWSEGQAEHMARVWGRARSEADKLARKDVSDTLFSYKQLKIDNALSYVLVFHYWQSRAIGRYAHIAAKNPWLIRVAYEMQQWFSETSGNPNLPPWVRGMLKYASLNGWSFYIDPLNVLMPWAQFRTLYNTDSERRDFDAWMDVVGLNPYIQAAASAFGWGSTQHAPNPFGTSGAANFAVSTADLVRNYVLPEWFGDTSHMGLSDNIDLVQRGLDAGTEFINEQLVDAGIPTTSSQEFADVGATRIRRVREIVESIYMEQHGIPLGKLESDDLDEIGRIIATYGTDNPDPILVQALQQETFQNTVKRTVNTVAPAPILTTYDPQYTRAAIRRGDIPATPQEVSQANALSDIATAGPNAQDVELTAANQAQQIVGTDEGRTALDTYNDIAYSDYGRLSDKYGNGAVLMVGGNTIGIAELAGMNDDQRKALAEQWVHGTPGLTDTYKHQSGVEKTFEASHPEYASYKDWQSRGYDAMNKKGVEETVRLLSSLYPGYADWVRKLPEDKRKKPGILLSLDGYQAAMGEMTSIYGEHGKKPDPAASAMEWMLDVQTGVGSSGSGGKSAPKTEEEKQQSKVASINEDLQKYEYQQGLYNQVIEGLGLNPDAAGQSYPNPYWAALMGAPSGDDPRLAGIPKPSAGSASEYLRWVEWKRRIDPNADLSVEAFVKETWIDNWEGPNKTSGQSINPAIYAPKTQGINQLLRGR